MVAPNSKVARRIETDPGSLALGVVKPDGANVVWYEIVDHDGQPASKYGGMRFGKTPKPLIGDEVPCPLEFAELLP